MTKIFKFILAKGLSNIDDIISNPYLNRLLVLFFVFSILIGFCLQTVPKYNQFFAWR